MIVAVATWPEVAMAAVVGATFVALLYIMAKNP